MFRGEWGVRWLRSVAMMFDYWSEAAASESYCGHTREGAIKSLQREEIECPEVAHACVWYFQCCVPGYWVHIYVNSRSVSPMTRKKPLILTVFNQVEAPTYIMLPLIGPCWRVVKCGHKWNGKVHWWSCRDWRLWCCVYRRGAVVNCLTPDCHYSYLFGNKQHSSNTTNLTHLSKGDDYWVFELSSLDHVVTMLFLAAIGAVVQIADSWMTHSPPHASIACTHWALVGTVMPSLILRRRIGEHNILMMFYSGVCANWMSDCRRIYSNNGIYRNKQHIIISILLYIYNTMQCKYMNVLSLLAVYLSAPWFVYFVFV